MPRDPTATDALPSSGFAPSTTLPDVELPAFVGKYKVTRRLGEGATSDVYLCHDPVSGQDVAIKRVLEQPADAWMFKLPDAFKTFVALVCQLSGGHPERRQC